MKNLKASEIFDVVEETRKIEDIQDWICEDVNFQCLPHEIVDQKIEVLANKISEIITFINKNGHK